MERTHFGQHGEACFGCHIRSVQFDGKPPSPQSEMERRWSKDMPAYRRLRDQGLQPRQIDGCAELEATANSELEVGLHLRIDPQVRKAAQSRIDEAAQMVRPWTSEEKAGIREALKK